MDVKENRMPFTGRLAFLILCAILLSARLVYVYLSDASYFPVETVKVSAPFEHVSRGQLETILAEFGYASFFSYPTKIAEKNIKQLSWVDSVKVQRVWPDALKIMITEKEPVALWNDHLITKNGDLLSTEAILEAEQLPELNGPYEQQTDVLQSFKKLSKLLEKNGLKIAAMKLSDNQAWEMTLTNGLVLRLGKNDIEQRLKRFCQAYPAVFVGKQDQLSSVDLRYARGMAVQWKEQTGK